MTRARIADIPTETYQRIVEELRADGWDIVYEYAGMDAGIDYGRIDLRRGDDAICCEWTWVCEGELEGPAAIVEAIRARHALR